MITHGTDAGPKCHRCDGTIWGYYQSVGNGTWRAHCMGCHAADYFSTAPNVIDIAMVREAHLDAHRPARQS